MNIKPNQKLDLDLKNYDLFYKKLREAVAYLDEHYGIPEKDKEIMEEVNAIMEGSRNPLDEDDLVFQKARFYGIVERSDLIQLMQYISAEKIKKMNQ